MKYFINDSDYTLIDKEDLPIAESRKWHISWNGYVIWRGVEHGVKKTKRLHRLIMGTPEGMDTDHINGVRHDNRKSNLRVVTRSENLHNKKEAAGFYYDKRRDCFYAEISVDNKKHFLGSFSNEKDAHNAYLKVKNGLQPKIGRISRRRKSYEV
jgi:hypothetical protein